MQTKIGEDLIALLPTFKKCSCEMSDEVLDLFTEKTVLRKQVISYKTIEVNKSKTIERFGRDEKSWYVLGVNRKHSAISLLMEG